MNYNLRNNDSEFIYDLLKHRLDVFQKTCCDHKDCNKKLSLDEVCLIKKPVVTGYEYIVCCSIHYLDSLFKFDRRAFDKVVEANFTPPKRGAIIMYFEMKYSTHNRSRRKIFSDN